MRDQIDRLFGLTAAGTDIRRELGGGAVTFLAMSYIVFVQPAVLSGTMFGTDTGLDFGAVMTATCLSAALATALMAVLARYPIAQAPGMGENFFFVLTVVPAAQAAGFAHPAHAALGVVFVSGVAFLALTFTGVRAHLLRAFSPSLRGAIAAGIGLFIALIGLRNTGLVELDGGLSLTDELLSPDLLVFGVGLLITGALRARGWRGAILGGIAAAAGAAIALEWLLPSWAPGWLAGSQLDTRFAIADAWLSAPPSLAPTFAKLDLSAALSASLLPFVAIFLLMDLLDTAGTLLGVSERAGFLRAGELPRAGRALVSDAAGTVAGACLGTSTVTSFIESAAGVEAGARTGLAGLVTAVLFLLALPFAPLVAMVGSYPPITAPALLVVGAMMLGSVRVIDTEDTTEALPAFLILLGIPATYSIADGLALGIVAYALLKLAAGRAREVHPVTWVLTLTLLAYFGLRDGLG